MMYPTVYGDVEDPITGVLDLVNRGSSLIDYLFW